MFVTALRRVVADKDDCAGSVGLRTVQRCLVEDAGGVGIELSECDHGEISNSRVNGAGNIVQNLPGITIHDSPYGVVTRCEVMNIAHR